MVASLLHLREQSSSLGGGRLPPVDSAQLRLEARGPAQPLLSEDDFTHLKPSCVETSPASKPGLLLGSRGCKNHAWSRCYCLRCLTQAKATLAWKTGTAEHVL